MKKYFFFAAAALAALAACTKVTPVTTEPDQEIAFKVVNYANSTKADPDQPTGHLAFTGTFGVFAYANAYANDNDTWATSGTTANVYMNNVEISKVGNVWKNAQTSYFWPKKAKLTFAAYAPYKATAPTFAKNTGFTFTNYEIPSTADADLMVADLATDLTANVTTQETAEGDGGYHFTQGVPLLFHHLLTSLQFKFQQAPYDNPNVNETASKITVTAVELRNFVGTKTYADNAWATNSAAGNAHYTVSTTATDIAKVSANAPTQIGNNDVIIMPQTLAAGPDPATAEPTDDTENGYQLLKVTYTVTTVYNHGTTDDTTDDTTLVEEDIVAYVPFRSDAVSAFTKNQKIVYTVTIYPYAKDEILFDPAVKSWDETTGTLTIK